MNDQGSIGGDTSDTTSLLGSQLTGREFGSSLDADQQGRPHLGFVACSSLSISGSTFYSERPTSLLKSTESLVSVTSDSKQPSERSIISLTPPSRSARSLSYGSHLETGRKLVLGLVIVVVIALSWVGSTQTAKSTLTGSSGGRKHFHSPFFVMWFGTGWMMAVYPLSCVVFFLLHRDKWSRKGARELWSHSTRLFSPNGITVLSLLTSTIPFTLIWAATNYMYTRALTVIEASDVTAIFSSAPAFVFLLSLLLLHEPPLILRLFAVCLAVGGIVLFAFEDGSKNIGGKLDSALGVALSVGAAVGAAFYKVLLKVRVKEASVYQMSLFLSSLGLFSTLFLWPVVLALQVTHTEVIAGSDVQIPWLFLCASSALSVLFNFSINFGIAYTYPLFISLGTVLGIPISALVDLLARSVNLFSTWKFAGVDLIVAGFLIMLLPPSDSRWIHRTLCCCSNCCSCSCGDCDCCTGSCDNKYCVKSQHKNGPTCVNSVGPC